LIDIERYYVTPRRCHVTQVSARLPDELVKTIDETARRMNRSRAEIIRQAIEYYLEDAEDLRLAIDRLQDPADPVLDWEDVKRDLLAQD
jgi:transposase